MTSSDILIQKLKEFEGCKLYAYRDSKGIPTIGVGHTKGVKMGQSITQKQAEAFLREDLATAEQYVNRLGVCKTQGQFDALVDFTFNVGATSLANSTLLKRIKANAPTAEIQAQFQRWVYAGKTKLAGLVRRRAWEASRWTY